MSKLQESISLKTLFIRGFPFKVTHNSTRIKCTKELCVQSLIKDTSAKKRTTEIPILYICIGGLEVCVYDCMSQ